MGESSTCNIILNDINLVNYTLKTFQDIFNFQINEIKTIDDWPWENECEIDYSQISKSIEINKIVMIYGTSEGYNLGLFIHKVDNCLSVSFWINNLPTSILYNEKFTNIIVHFLSTSKVEWIMNGAEIEIPENISFCNTLKCNDGMIAYWVCKKNTVIHNNKDYMIIETEDTNYKIGICEDFTDYSSCKNNDFKPIWNNVKKDIISKRNLKDILDYLNNLS